MTISRSPERAAFDDAFRRYLAEPNGGAAEDAAGFERRVRSSDMRYAGQPLDVAYFPLAVPEEDLAALGRVVERTHGLLERATARLLESPEIEREFGWPAERLRVVRHDPGYGLAIPCARLDSYWNGGGEIKFLEVNTDGTSGMTNVERVAAFFLESRGVRALIPRFRLENFVLRERVLEALLDCYREWRARGGARRGAPEEPRIAIVDWRTVKTSAEFRAFAAYFESRGLRATIADPRDLAYDGRALRDRAGEGAPIDLIYRRVVSTEYFSCERAEVAAMTEAYLDGAVCVAGSFRSDIAFDKRLLSLLTTAEIAGTGLGVSDEDIEFAARVFAWTRTLRPGPILELARRERERLVLKPAALYEGRGVRIGIETPEGEWLAALERAAPAGDHVIQERIVPPELTVGILEEGRFRPRPLHLSLGEYAFGGRLAGFIARVASTLILSADADERVLPVVRLGRP